MALNFVLVKLAARFEEANKEASFLCADISLWALLFITGLAIVAGKVRKL